MFTGIVRGRGKVVHNEGRTLEVSAAFGRLRRGSSVSVNGVCLTVTRQRGRSYAFDVSPETLRLTNLGRLWVSGHVDCCASVLKRSLLRGGFVRVRISLPKVLRRMVAYKGSISVDGTSLTVTRVGPSWFETVLIPETLEKTTFGVYEEGAVVNLEVDLIARYLDRLLKARGL
jgi:riboflavin synthase